MLAALALLLMVSSGCIGCGTEEAPKKDTANGATDEDDVEDTTEADAGAETVQDVVQDTDTATTEVKADGTGDADAEGKCLTAGQCADKLKLKICEQAACVDGACVAQLKPGFCCDDGPCDDKNPGTDDKCDLASGKCENTPKPGFCAGKQYFKAIEFEQSSLEDFKVSADNNPNDNVSWKLDTRRARSGKTSLYLGNECGSYDASMTAASACKSSGSGGAVNVKLKAPEVLIPKETVAALHFWIWLDLQVPYRKLLPKGTCASPCPEPGSCVVLPDGGGAQCLKEQDVLTLKVNGNAVWYSTQIDNTTGGQWKHVVVNLAGAEQAPLVEWEFTANAQKNDTEGVYLDDWYVETICAENLCSSGQACKDDADVCTGDVCTDFLNLTGKGVCFFDKAPGCCTGVNHCNDKNDCTIDECKKAAGAEQGTCSNKPDAANIQCCQPASLLTESFESGSLSTWQLSGSNSTTVNWGINPKGGVGASQGACFANSTFTSFDDPTLGKTKGPKGTLCSKEIKLQAGTVYNVATFQLMLDTEWTGGAADKYKNPPEVCSNGVCQPATPYKLDELRVEVKSAGQLFPVWSSDAIAGTTNGKYLPMQVNLDKWAGKTVNVCFTFDAGDGYNNTGKGACVDDVKAEVACTEGICLSDEDPKCAGKCDPVCETVSCIDGDCLCNKVAGCCENDAACDDGDVCTTDKCNLTTKKCEATLTSETCCSNKTPLAEAFDAAKGSMPAGWKIETLKGNAQGGTGKPYDTLVKWNVSALKYTSANWSLYFGNNGTYNAGDKVPGAQATGPEIALPKNGTSLVTFSLFLSTEWDGVNFVEPPFGLVVDRMRVGLYDATQTDVTKQTEWLWSSYSIAGTTNGKWQSVVFAVPDAWKGKKGRLRFEFDAGHVQNNNFEGAYVDDLQIQTVCTKPDCVADKDCVPATDADPCKKYFCAQDKSSQTLAFQCKTDFKPGPTCCQPSVLTPLETFESGKLDGAGWLGSCTPGVDVNWTVVPHKYLTGNYEAYMGNPAKSNYADGTSSVQCTLQAKAPLTLSLDPKKSAQVTFKLWLDIEKSFESFRLVVAHQGGKDVVWDKTKGTDMALGEYKTLVQKTVDISAYKGKGAISLIFEFDSGDEKGNDKYQGIYLDDLQVTEPCL